MCEELVPILHMCEELVPILHTREKIAPVLHRCDEYVPVLHTSEIINLRNLSTNFRPQNLSKLTIRKFLNLANVTYWYQYFLWVWNLRNEKFTVQHRCESGLLQRKQRYITGIPNWTMSRYNVGLKTLLQGLSEKLIGKTDSRNNSKRLPLATKGGGYNMDILRQTACIVGNPIMFDNFASLFNCTTVNRSSD